MEEDVTMTAEVEVTGGKRSRGGEERKTIARVMRSCTYTCDLLCPFLSVIVCVCVCVNVFCG